MLVQSCTCDRQPDSGQYNLFGGQCRRSSYEAIDFRTQIITEINLNCPDSSGAVNAPLSLDDDELIIPTTNGSLVFVSEFQAKWYFKLDTGEYVAAGMCADNEKNIYAISNKGTVYSVSKDGQLNWKIRSADTNANNYLPSDLLCTKDGIYSSLGDGAISKISFGGEILWQRHSVLSPTRMFAADENGNLIISITQNIFGGTDSLIVLSPTGKLKWGLEFAGARLIQTPVVSNGIIYVPALKDIGPRRVSTIYSIDTAGKILWEKNLSVVPRFISVSGDGTLYVIGYNAGIGEALSGVFAFDPGGKLKYKLKWKIFFEASVSAPLMLGGNAIAFTGSTKDGPGLFFIDYVSGNLVQSIALNDRQVIYLQPVVTSGGVIVYAGTDRLGLMQIDDTPMNKLWPF